MDEKEELIKIRNKLTELERHYKFQIADNMKNKKMINILSNLSNLLMVCYRNLDSAVFYLDKLNQEQGRKYEE
jgi:hypothetical protein